MKKLMTALVALTVIVFATSCNNSTTKVLSPGTNEFTFTATMDTSINVKVPVTSQINLCSGGKSQFKKITNWKDSTVHLVKGQTITISNDEMNGKGWFYFPNGVGGTDQTGVTDNSGVSSSTSNAGSSFNWFPDWLKTLLAFLFWALVIGLLLWLVALLIREFLNWLNNPPVRRNITSEEHVEEGIATNPIQRPVPVIVSVRNETTVVNEPPVNNGNGPLFTITGGQGAMTIGNITIHTGGKHNEHAKADGGKSEEATK